MTTMTVKDPVCGMEIHATSGGPQSEYKGESYSFCSSGCKVKFDHDPEQYMCKSGTAASNKGGGCCG